MKKKTKSALRSALPLFILVVLCIQAVAQDLVIVRSRKEIASNKLDPSLNDKINRGQVVFRGGLPGVRNGPDPYQTVIVYPQPNSAPREQSFTGKDANGNLYYRGYPVAPSGWISAKVEPADAEVLVDGRPVSLDRASGISEKMGMLTGKHKVEARKTGFKPYVGEVEVRQASEVRLDIKLVK